MNNNSSNKKSSGWNVNSDKFDADEHNRQIAARDESWGMGRLCDDVIQNPGGLRARLEELANSNNSEVNQVLSDHGITNPRLPQRFFLSDKTPCVVYLDDSGWHATAYTREGEIRYTGGTRDGVMLLAEASSSTHKTPRQLTAEERLRVARLAAPGGESALTQAIELYVSLRLDTMPRKSAREVLEDPALTGLLNEAARFCWAAGRQDCTPSEEFESLLDKVAATKPLTINVIDALFDKYEVWKSAAARSTRPPAPLAEPETDRAPAATPEEIQRGLEGLTTDQLERLRLQTLKHRGQLIRRFDERISGGR